MLLSQPKKKNRYKTFFFTQNLQTPILDFVFWGLLLWQSAGVEFPPQEENNVPVFTPPPIHRPFLSRMK
ncbi:hypothetical protein ACS0TY_036755 [Phlomoides rotata]